LISIVGLETPKSYACSVGWVNALRIADWRDGAQTDGCRQVPKATRYARLFAAILSPTVRSSGSGPYVREMVAEAITSLGCARPHVVAEWVTARYGAHRPTVDRHLISLCVNHPGRTHYLKNKRARGFDERWDILYKDHEDLVPYSPPQHGRWVIVAGGPHGFGIHREE
jgi:hypothetical protein